MKNTSPHVIVLVGPPGSGKTTWIKANGEGHTVISSDDLLEAWGNERGLTYSEAFKQADMKSIERQMFAAFEAALLAEKCIIIDRTNMNVKSRNRFLSMVPRKYAKYAVVFTVSREELNKRLDQRPGKIIPPFVVDSMLASYQEPTNAEFDKVFFE
jgi:predicted kinase